MCVFYFSCPESTHAFLKLDANSRLAWGRCGLLFPSHIYPCPSQAQCQLDAILRLAWGRLGLKLQPKMKGTAFTQKLSILSSYFSNLRL